jgi:hypothetical protein
VTKASEKARAIAQAAVGAEEGVRAAIPAQAGRLRPEVVVGVLLLIFLVTGIVLGAIPVLIVYWLAWKYRVVVVTDGGVRIFRATVLRQRTPRELLMQLPSEATVQIGGAGIWRKLLLDGHTFWVHRTYRSEIATLVAELGVGGSSAEVQRP